jgi:hypothetical protein
MRPRARASEGEAYQPQGQWQLTLAYRRLAQSPVLKVHTIVADSLVREQTAARPPGCCPLLGRLLPAV